MANPNRSTATAQNRLAGAELDEFLGGTCQMTLATPRTDGYWHVTPLWYLWRDSKVYFTLVEGRRHLENLRRDPRATICVSEDRRPEEGLAGRARAAMFCGPVELVGPRIVTLDEDVIRPVLTAIAGRYLGPAADAVLADLFASGADLRTMAILTPEVQLAFDLTKG